MRNKIDMHSLKLENTNYLLCHDDRVEMRKLAFVINFSDFVFPYLYPLIKIVII